ncbi:HNH endonuclease [Dermabacteraceae bacterium P13077]
MPTWRNDRAYVKRREALKRKTRLNNLPCALCTQPIDTNLPYTHPMSFTADHITPIAAGGNMNGPLQPAHRACNSRKGKKTTPTTARPKPTTSRDW